MSPRTRYLTLGLGVVLLAAILRLVGIGWGLPQIYEEATPMKEAWTMWGWGPTAEFDLNPHFFKYPSLSIYLNFLGQAVLYLILLTFGSIRSVMDYRALYVVDPTAFVIAGRAISFLFSLGSVWLVYVLGKRAGGYGVAVAAGLLLAVNTFSIERAQMIEVDVPLTFFVLLAVWRTLRFRESPVTRNAVWVGITMGLAASSKYTGALLAVPALLAYLTAAGSPAPPAAKRRKGKKGGRRRLPSWKLLAWMGGAAAGTFLLTSPFVLLDFRAFWSHLAAERQHMEMGHFGLGDNFAPFFYARSLVERLLGWPLTACALGGLVHLAFVRREPWAMMAAAFTVPYLLTVGAWAMMADRYLLPILPLLILFGVALVFRLLEGTPGARIPARLRPAAAGLLVIVLAANAVLAYPDHLRRRGKDPRTEARLWVESTVPTGAFIATEWLGPEFLTPNLLWPLEAELRQRAFSLSGRPLFAVQIIPLFQVYPERSAPYYDHGLYRMADLVITSSAVRSRYVKDPSRFAAQLAFYDTLETRFRKLAVFQSDGGAGPTITVYRNPETEQVFGARDSVAGPKQLEGLGQDMVSGEESYFFYTLGLNYEAFGFYEEALRTYWLALQYPMLRRNILFNLSTAVVRCLDKTGRRAEAVEFLAMVKDQASDPAERARINRLYESLRRSQSR